MVCGSDKFRSPLLLSPHTNPHTLSQKDAFPLEPLAVSFSPVMQLKARRMNRSVGLFLLVSPVAPPCARALTPAHAHGLGNPNTL